MGGASGIKGSSLESFAMNLRSKVQPMPQLPKLASYSCFTYQSIVQSTSASGFK